MPPKLRRKLKKVKISRAELTVAISTGIQLAVKDWLHEINSEINAKATGLVKYILKRVFQLLLTGAVLGLLHMIFHGKYQKLADFLVNWFGGN